MTTMTAETITQITIAICMAIQNRGSSLTVRGWQPRRGLLDDRQPQRDRYGVRARVRLELRDDALGVRLHGLDRQPDAASDLLGVEALRQELEDLALALG